MTRVLVTGGAGYVGSHTLMNLLSCGYDILVVDNFDNASPVALEHVQRLSNRDLSVVNADIRDRSEMATIVREFAPDAAVHFAGLKAVDDSVQRPLDYYDVNVAGSISLLIALEGSPCRRLVFSSSCTVYGDAQYLPVDEAHPLRPRSPYGFSKLHVEQMLIDLAASDRSWAVALLRYFNPVGAHPSGDIGEDPTSKPNNLMPIVAQVAVGRLRQLSIWGDDYPTPDGTGIRDYIHVMDLARAHGAALRWTEEETGCEAFNLGTGSGTSVRELIEAFEAESGCRIPAKIAPRRDGDVAETYADPSKARQVLGWQAERDIHDMCASTWAWQRQNPYGYQKAEIANDDAVG